VVGNPILRVANRCSQATVSSATSATLISSENVVAAVAEIAADQAKIGPAKAMRPRCLWAGSPSTEQLEGTEEQPSGSPMRADLAVRAARRTSQDEIAKNLGAAQQCALEPAIERAFGESARRNCRNRSTGCPSTAIPHTIPVSMATRPSR
jgi:hypothetical protein